MISFLNSTGLSFSFVAWEEVDLGEELLFGLCFKVNFYKRFFYYLRGLIMCFLFFILKTGNIGDFRS
jgi:hypothetical protein